MVHSQYKADDDCFVHNLLTRSNTPDGSVFNHYLVGGPLGSWYGDSIFIFCWYFFVLEGCLFATVVLCWGNRNRGRKGRGMRRKDWICRVFMALLCVGLLQPVTGRRVAGQLERNAAALADGTQLDIQRGSSESVYRLADGTRLLEAGAPNSPDSVVVGGLENFFDLGEAAQEGVRPSWFRSCSAARRRKRRGRCLARCRIRHCAPR